MLSDDFAVFDFLEGAISLKVVGRAGVGREGVCARGDQTDNWKLVLYSYYSIWKVTLRELDPANA